MRTATPTDSGDGSITGSAVVGNGNLSGYVTIDMANFCTLSNPSSADYWDQDAAGWENNLFGDYIIVSNSGIPTLGASDGSDRSGARHEWECRSRWRRHSRS